MSRRCLECVFKVMEGELCFFVLRGHLEGVYEMSGKYREGVWKVSDWP